MIDLTPLDVRKKAGDFRKVLRGYEPREVDGFLALVAERFEELVRENLTLRERTERLQEQVATHEVRERAVNEALVTAQQLSQDVKEQAQREAELMKQEAEAALSRRSSQVERRLEDVRRSITELEWRRARFFSVFRSLLERELDALGDEEARVTADGSMPLEAIPPGRPAAEGPGEAPEAEGDASGDLEQVEAEGADGTHGRWPGPQAVQAEDVPVADAQSDPRVSQGWPRAESVGANAETEQAAPDDGRWPRLEAAPAGSEPREPSVPDDGGLDAWPRLESLQAGPESEEPRERDDRTLEGWPRLEATPARQETEEEREPDVSPARASWLRALPPGEDPGEEERRP